MPNSTASTPKTLADEIRDSEPLFIDAAVKAFRERFAIEYRRLRGYALEAGQDNIQLNVEVLCVFDRTAPAVAVRSVPDFQPQKGEARVAIRSSLKW